MALKYFQIQKKEILQDTLLIEEKYGKCFKIGIFINNNTEDDGPGHYADWSSYEQIFNNSQKNIEITFSDGSKQLIALGKTGIYEIRNIESSIAENKFISSIKLNNNLLDTNFFIDLYCEEDN